MTGTEFDAGLELERRRRLLDCWQRGAPTELEVNAAARRYLLRTEAVGRSGGLGGYVLAAALGSALTVAVLALIGWVGLPAGQALEARPEVFAPIESPPDNLDVTSREPRVGAPAARAEAEEPATAASVQMRRMRVSRRVATGDGAEGSDAWTRAARALRERDTGAAEQAFEQLRGSAVPGDQDAAELALAQLWISTGRGQKARSVLERLANEGSTPTTRRRAVQLLGEIE